MLALKQKQRGFSWRITTAFCAILLLLAGLYVLTLVMAPTFSGLILKPLNATQVAAIKPTQDRIMIPKIGVNIPYGTDGKASLDEGAEWRLPDNGNPKKGGNFVIAAHRFSIQPTPGGTIKKSPFYHIDELKKGDQILVDYDGTRYGYTVESKETVPPTAVQIESPSATPKLTLYSCSLGGSADGRYVIIGKPLGEVAIGN